MTEILQTTPMRPAQTNTRSRFAMSAGACDTNFHVFEPGFPHVPDPLYTFPDGTVDQYLRVTEVLGIERMVLVQPTFYGTDNSLLADVLRRVAPRARGVVRIEEDAADAELDRYHDLGVLAILLDLFARRDRPTAELIGYVRRMSARAAPRGWHIQFYSPGTVVRDLLPFLADGGQYRRGAGRDGRPPPRPCAVPSRRHRQAPGSPPRARRRHRRPRGSAARLRWPARGTPRQALLPRLGV